MFKLIAIIITGFVLFSSTLMGQNSLKLSKQKSSFFYTQVNLHGGINSIQGEQYWGEASKSPSNQIAFQYLKKNQKLMQKGYVRLIAPASYSIKVSLPFYSGDGLNEVKLKLLDASLKFNTKWDRTNFWVGYKSLPYGHNPQIDPVSNFSPNPASKDIGFGQDLGLFFKTPLSQSLDLEFSLSSGGLLNNALLTYKNQSAGLETGSSQKLSGTHLSYQNTWLSVARIGNQSFKRDEIGLIFLAGRLKSDDYQGDFENQLRIGAEWIHKTGEKLKISQQLTTGFINPEMAEEHYAVSYQGQLEFTIIKRLVFSTAKVYSNKIYAENPLSNKIGTYNSLGYRVTPHTRVRINNYFSSSNTNKADWGLFLQLVTGFGKRN